MGIRLLSVHHRAACHLILRNTSASASTPAVKKYEAASPELAKEIEESYKKLDLTFTNTKEAFKKERSVLSKIVNRQRQSSKSNLEMMRALMVFQMCGIKFLVQNNNHILNVMRKALGKNLFKKVIKSTFFGHFVAGETKQEVEPVVARLKRFGVKSILDYSAESDLSAEEASTKTAESNLKESVEPPAIKDNVDTQTTTKTHKRYASHKEFADRRKDVVSARTYFYEGEHNCDKNRDIFMESIDAVAAATGGEGFAAIKITALGRPALLLKLSVPDNMIRWIAGFWRRRGESAQSIAQAHNFFKALSGPMIQLNRLTEEDFVKKLKEFGVKANTKNVREWFNSVDFDDDGHIDFHGWSKLLDDNAKLGEMFRVLNIKTGNLEPLITNLSAIEEQEFANMVRRTREITEYAIRNGIRIMIDAEQTYFQPAISRLSIEMMRKYNKEQGNVFNTYQAYLKDTLMTMECDMQLARREGWHFGAKLVRGAYMEQERKRAETVGYEDPVNPSYEATSQHYEQCLTRIADEHDRRGKGKVSVMIATHNEDTVRYAVKLMKERGIAPSEKIMCFAQLYGMCDQVSFSLGQAGYSVYKYLPYGPVEEVLPYLSRRALENGSVLAKAKKDKDLLWKEFKRRLAAGQWSYTP